MAARLPLQTTGADISGVITSAQLAAIHEAIDADRSEKCVDIQNCHLDAAVNGMTPALSVDVSSLYIAD